MKSIVIFFDEHSEFEEKKVFDGKNALELSRNWACALGLEYFYVNVPTLADFLQQVNHLVSENHADCVVFSYSDLPFLNVSLTEKLLKSHFEYKCEYSFADGFPYGFAPEIIDAGTLKILYEMTQKTQLESGKKCFSRSAIFDLIKTDINAFEVNSVLSETDWRLWRFAFHCGHKENFLQCENLFKAAVKKNLSVFTMNDESKNCNAEILCKTACETLSCLKTVPAFYDIQICDKETVDCIYSPYFDEYAKKNNVSADKSQNFMSFDLYSKLLDEISKTSGSGVISLSAWGEPLCHPDFLKIIEKTLSYQGFSVFLETSCFHVDKEFCLNLKNIVENALSRKNDYDKIMICVKLDAFSGKMYQKIHPNAKEGDFENLVENVKTLCEVLPGFVYPQFVRMNENEEELESFFRFWNEKTNPSGGKLTVQKYQNYCNLLCDRKPADLSPLERNPCWHLRRDMTILSNGDVPMCKQCVFSNIVGNVFTESIEKIWRKTDDVLLNHLHEKYPLPCEKCDEYYTYNF